MLVGVTDVDGTQVRGDGTVFGAGLFEGLLFTTKVESGCPAAALTNSQSGTLITIGSVCTVVLPAAPAAGTRYACIFLVAPDVGLITVSCAFAAST